MSTIYELQILVIDYKYRVIQCVVQLFWFNQCDFNFCQPLRGVPATEYGVATKKQQ
jgi:hypothetical protein